VTAAYQLHDAVGLYKLQPFHCWSLGAVERRFQYGRPGLLALVVRVYRSQRMHEFPEIPAYAGCKSWVELQKGLTTDNAVPVLTDAQFEAQRKQIEELLRPDAVV
jgi:hypothetical protein